jgi:DNA protecting protein DprA
VASELARDLAAADVVVVSGLAEGIDGAAHSGVISGDVTTSAPPVAVVGTGVDVVYPRSNRSLWEQVRSRGAIFSESPLGTRPRPRVFPARNRIIAALADVVVVVECHHDGGSMYTVDAAARRGIPVCAVPGSVRSAASSGTNGLLVDGCIPVRDAADVQTAVSLARAGRITRSTTPAMTTPVTATTPATATEYAETGNAVTGSRRGGDRHQASVHEAALAPTVSSEVQQLSTTSDESDKGDPPSDFLMAAEVRTGEHPRAGSSSDTGPYRKVTDGGSSSREPEFRRTAAGAGRVGNMLRVVPPLTPLQEVVWNAVGDGPTVLETILLRTDLSIAVAGEVCAELVASGALVAGAGWWCQA